MKVTYAMAGPEEGKDVPTILFCAGMFGTRFEINISIYDCSSVTVSKKVVLTRKHYDRYQAVWFDYIAQKKGARILLIDR
jgi:hypothetical protein